MTFQGEKENCQIKYKGGAITGLWALFNSSGAMPPLPGKFQDLQFTFSFMYITDCYDADKLLLETGLLTRLFYHICNIFMCRQRIRAERRQEKLEHMYFAFITASFSGSQIKNSLERNAINCTLFLYWPVLTSSIQRAC